MKTFFLALVVILSGSLKTCLAQPPQWITDLTNEVFTLEVGQITHWEEKQMTWYHINDLPDGSDSVSVNTLYVEGTTTSGQRFIGAIPVTDHELNPLGSRRITGQTCTGQCGCQCCKFKKEDHGCFCDSTGEGGQCCATPQGGTCTCWCQHTITSGD